MNSGTERQAEGEKYRREQTDWRVLGIRIQVDSERYKGSETDGGGQHIGSLEKGERRRAESLLLGRGHMTQAGRGADKSRSGKGAKHRSDSKTGWQTGGPQSLSLSLPESESFLSCRWIPFVDLSTTTGMGTGTSKGSGDSSKEARSGPRPPSTHSWQTASRCSS